MEVAREYTAVDLAFEALGSEGWQERQCAIESLIALAPQLDAASRGELTDRLIHEVVEPRTIASRAAAQEVLTHFGREVVPEVLERVESQGPGARLLVDLIAFLGEEQDVPVLERIYLKASNDQNLRAAIASVLGAIGGSKACAVLWRMLEEPEPHLRVFALDGLRMARYCADPDRLVELAQDLLTRKAAVSMLGHCQDAKSIHPLLEFLCDNVRGVRAAALVSIGGLLSWAKSQGEDQDRAAIYGALSALNEEARDRLDTLARNGDREVLCTALEVAQVCVHVPLLAVAVEHMDDGAVYERALSLAAICGEATPEFFEPWLDDPTQASVLEPIYRLVAMSNVPTLSERWAQHLLMQVQGGQVELASAACEALGKCADEDLIDGLFEYCKEEGPVGEYVADAVAGLLQRHGRSVRSLFEDQGPTPWESARIEGPMARNLCRIMGKVGDPDAHHLLEKVLNCSDVDARIAAIVALGRVQAQGRTESLLGMALADEDPQARAAACRSLARLGICRAESGLVAATADVSAFVRAAAVQSLVNLDCRASRGRLIEMIDSQDSPAVLAYAIEGLGKWSEPEDQARLIALTEHPDLEIVKAAIRSLDGYRAAKVSKVVASLLEHERWDVRWVCAESLKERRDPLTLDALERAELKEEDPLVHETISAARLAVKESEVHE